MLKVSVDLVYSQKKMSVDGQFGHLFHAPIMQVPRTRLYELFRPEWTVSQLARME